MMTIGISVNPSSLDSSSRLSKRLPKWTMLCKRPPSPSTPIHGPELILCAREKKDLADLSSLGHFLKGSSATLGLTKVKDSCEKIQHYGQKKDEEGTTDVDDEELCLKRIKETLETVKEEYEECEKVLKKYYATQPVSS
jgi:HPt (histidine-containing phosphotransfer) domain-containing protein